MRAVVVTSPHRAEVQEVPDPVAGPGEVVVDVARVGICGTDAELFTGEMDYVERGITTYPLVLGHEGCGTVSTIGAGVDASWLGRRVTGDTMLGCGQCARCRTGRQHVCAERSEIGIRGANDGALAERLRLPARALIALPDSVDDVAGAMVEPGGNAVRALDAAAVTPGERLLVVGTGTIGLLVAALAVSRGTGVDLAGLPGPSLDAARTLSVGGVCTLDELAETTYDAVVDASNGADVPARVLDLVEPGRRLVLIGLSSAPSLVDTRQVALADVTVVGILSASGGLAGAVSAYSSGAVDPTGLVAATIGLEEAPGALAGARRPGAGRGPKLHVDPRAAGPG